MGGLGKGKERGERNRDEKSERGIRCTGINDGAIKILRAQDKKIENVG